MKITILYVLTIIISVTACYAQTETWLILNKTAGLAYGRNDFKKALQFWEQSRILAENKLGKEHKYYLNSIENLAGTYKAIGDYVKAEVLYLEALKIKEKAFGKQSNRYAVTIKNLAELNKLAGNLTKADSQYVEAIKITEKALGKENLYSRILLDWASLYEEMGNFNKAESLYTEALKITEKTKDDDFYYSNILSLLSSLYIRMGKLGKARSLEDESMRGSAARQAEIGGDQEQHFGIYLASLALHYKDRGNFSKAESLYLKALPLIEKRLGKSNSEYVNCLYNLALLYEHLHKYNKAKPLLVEALKVKELALGNRHPDYAVSLGFLANLYKLLGNYTRAETLFQQELQVLEKAKGKSHFDYAKCLMDLALCYNDTGDYDKAEPILQEAHDNLLRQVQINFPTLSDREKVLFFNENLGYRFEIINSFASKCQKLNLLTNAHLYNNLLATKSMRFNFDNKIRNSIFNSNDTSLVNLYKEWKGKRNFLAKLFKMTLVQKQQAGLNQDSLEEEINLLEKQLSIKSEAFAQMTDKTVYTWQDVQKTLGPREAAIEVLRFRWFSNKPTSIVYYAALVITANSKQPAYILLTNGNDLESNYTTLYQNSTQGRDIIPNNQVKKLADANLLYRQFWAPIATHASLKNVNTIYFSADGVYHRLNLNTLLNPRTGKYVLDELDIHEVSSTRDLIIKRKSNPSINNATLIGFPNYNDTSINGKSASGNRYYPNLQKEKTLVRLFNKNDISELPGTKEEIINIAKILREHDVTLNVLLQSEASEEAVKELQGPQILHIASHGFFLRDISNKKGDNSFLGIDSKTLNDNPMLRSGLLLAGCKSAFSPGINDDTKEDGVLTAYEAMNLSLQGTDLVVLSACETGLGEVRISEGVFGLQRAFQTAGAKAVLMSLWRVDDNATQQMMTFFYQKLFSSGSIQSAFKQAQLTLRKIYPDPYYWGAFVLIGG
jgi:CHAT domain-containing protein